MANNLRKVLQRNLLACLRNRDLDEAGRLLETLREEDPLSVETRGLELEYLIAREQWDEAKPLAEQLVHLFPNSARIHLLAGRLAYRQRRYPDAEHHFRESQRIHPFWFTQLFLGKTLTQKGDFDEAESILSRIVQDHASARCDLSWLYERQGHVTLALREMEAHLRDHPDDPYAREQQRRLRSLSMEPEEVVEEIDTLRELGEQVDEKLLPEYVDGLLRTGQATRAREHIEQVLAELSPSVAARAGWNCYRLQVYDLSLKLFLHALPSNCGNVKMLSALETSARRSGQLDEVIERYRTYVATDPRFYGRIRRLTR